MKNFSEADKSPLDPLWAKADEAARKGDFEGVLFILKSLADKGIWQAYARIGALYETGGGGVEKNIDQALSWYRKAVFEADDPIAHLGLGRAYYSGEGVERDYSKAFENFQRAWIARIPEAGIYLGIMYYFGVGISKDHSKARECFEFSASSEYFLAYGYLARIEIAQGKIVKGLKLLIQGWLLMAKLSKGDPGDRRLLGIEQPRSTK